MDEFVRKLKAAGFNGEVDSSDKAREFYSHDASMFEIKPQLVVMPKDSKDVQTLIKLVAANKKNMPELSVTARSAGTDMSGGAINDSIIVDFNKHFTKIHGIGPDEGHVEPGVFYRDFDKATRAKGLLMPAFPASRDLCTVGGMVANNAGGEKSLEFGKVEKFVNELTVIFGDGKEYKVRPLNRAELVKKMAQKDFEGKVYREVFHLIERHYDKIKAAKPRVTKNSMGYNLWNVWDRETGVFDLTQLIVGSQGTLGFVTDIKYRLIRLRPFSGTLVCFMKKEKTLDDVVAKVLTHKPATFEAFDDHTLWLAIRFLPSFVKFLGVWGVIKLMLSLIPDGLMLLKGVPKLVLIIGQVGHTQEEVDQKIDAMYDDLKPFKMAMEKDDTREKSQKFLIMRRQSFNLLRSKVHDKHTAPFIDDMVVDPKYLTEFLPKIRRIIKKYRLLATIAGHIGDGNFHIIPLMKIEKKSERAKLLPAMEEVNQLVLRYKGSLSGEHNDGLVRGPWLEEQYGREMVQLFRETNDIFDPDNIFNPHKKASADWDYSFSHIRKSF